MQLNETIESFLKKLKNTKFTPNGEYLDISCPSQPTEELIVLKEALSRHLECLEKHGIEYHRDVDQKALKEEVLNGDGFARFVMILAKIESTDVQLLDQADAV